MKGLDANREYAAGRENGRCIVFPGSKGPDWNDVQAFSGEMGHNFSYVACLIAMDYNYGNYWKMEGVFGEIPMKERAKPGLLKAFFPAHSGKKICKDTGT